MNKLHLAQLPTPIEKIDYLSNKYKPNIFVKRDDLTDSVASGNKIRKLEYSVAEALSLGCDTLITNGGFQSNHCRSTAAVAAKLGLKCILILRKEPGENIETANFLLDHMLGDDISHNTLFIYAVNNLVLHRRKFSGSLLLLLLDKRSVNCRRNNRRIRFMAQLSQCANMVRMLMRYHNSVNLAAGNGADCIHNARTIIGRVNYKRALIVTYHVDVCLVRTQNQGGNAYISAVQRIVSCHYRFFFLEPCAPAIIR